MFEIIEIVTLPRLASTLVSCLFAGPVAYYIARQRDRLARTAVPLAPRSRGQLTAYFTAADLDRTRLVESGSVRIPEPPFRSQLRYIGFYFPSTSLVAAITFDHVIAAREALSPSLLFHELVHVVQYRLLGVNRFSRLYVRGFLSRGTYEEIPLECCASELEHRFASDQRPFSVQAEVARWIELDLF